VNPADWQTLLAAPGGTAYLGIYTHPDDGREEMVMTVAGNQFQNHAQLLRDGMLNWVTRGVFLGYARNYLELQVDDLFLGDDAWDSNLNVTGFAPGTASRMTPADVDKAIAWSRASGLRLTFAFNGGGSDAATAAGGVDPLTDKFADPNVRGAFDYVNHTYDHPNLDCSSASFITSQITRNRDWASAHGIPLNPGELVTGEHSGLANTRPGNPGKIDPPIFDAADPAATAGAAVAPGAYDYALTASSAAGETTASIVPSVTVAAPNNSVSATFNAICHAVTYSLYRSAAGANTWTRVATLARGATAATDDGLNPLVLTLTDTGAAGTAAALPAANNAALAPYPQNPLLLGGLTGAGIQYVAEDASKTYAAGDLGSAVQAFPRYPSNVYYNVSKQGQQLDEYNWIYVAPGNGGGCVPITGVTTCRTTPATWADYVSSETSVMLRHITGNDPRPHFMHQSNLADYNPALPETDPAQGGILYPVIDALLARYGAAFDRAKAPLVQLSSKDIAGVIARQAAWAAGQNGVTAWLQDGHVHVQNTGSSAISVPLTGTTVGDAYGGQNSGWTSVSPGAQLDVTPVDPVNASAPGVSGTERVGQRLSATQGGWTGTGPISYTYRWQRCSGTTCSTIPGATGATYDLADADAGNRVRVVVTAGNWTSSVSQAASPLSAAVTRSTQAVSTHDDPAERNGSGLGAGGGGGSSATRARLSLTAVKMTPRRFPVAHKRKLRGTRPDGSRISWKLNRAATVSVRFERRAGKHWVRVGTITRKAKAGTGVVRFRGRFGSKLLAPKSYRIVVTAAAGGQRTAAKRVGFRVVKG
jgi:hypothetical protein